MGEKQKRSIAKYNAQIPKNVARIIEGRGFKQSAVARRAGFSSQQFSDMLNGRKIIKPCDILTISDALGVNIEDLFIDTSQSSTQEVK